MVRLKEGEGTEVLIRVKSFNSLMVRLKARKDVIIFFCPHKFQFLDGAIKSKNRFDSG